MKQISWKAVNNFNLIRTQTTFGVAEFGVCLGALLSGVGVSFSMIVQSILQSILTARDTPQDRRGYPCGVFVPCVPSYSIFAARGRMTSLRGYLRGSTV